MVKSGLAEERCVVAYAACMTIQTDDLKLIPVPPQSHAYCIMLDNLHRLGLRIHVGSVGWWDVTGPDPTCGKVHEPCLQMPVTGVVSVQVQSLQGS